MTSKVYLIRLKVDGKESSHFKTKVEWFSDENKFKMLLLTGEHKAYEAEVSEGDIAKIGEESRIEGVEQWAEEAFKSSSGNHVFAVDDSKMELVWKKTGGGKMKVRVGAFPLREVDFGEASDQVLDASMDDADKLRCDYESLYEKNATLRSDYAENRKLLAEVVKDKEAAEKQLYERFLPLLQSKQARISELMSNGGASVEMKEEDDSYGSDTDKDDDESDKTPSKVPRLDDSVASQKSVNDSQNPLEMK